MFFPYISLAVAIFNEAFFSIIQGLKRSVLMTLIVFKMSSFRQFLPKNRRGYREKQKRQRLLPVLKYDL